MATTDLVIPDRTELAQLSSPELYKLEVLGDISKEILDDRVAEWGNEGWTTRRISDELGCSQSDASRRCRRLRDEGRITRDPDSRGGGRLSQPDSNSESPEHIESAGFERPTPKSFSVPEMSRKGYIMSLTDLLQDMKQQFPSPWNRSDEYQRQIEDAIQYLQSLKGRTQ